MSKVLVAYFSASGVTKKVAEKLAEVVKGDIFEIKPEVPYTDADLDWENNKSRSSIEMNDASSRPKIAEKVNDMNKYSIIFVGFPIWWYRQPSIIDTFIESYDFNGKTIVPFATSGMSSIGESGKIMQALVPNAKVVAGKRFPDSVKTDELKKWASEWVSNKNI